MFEAFVRDSKSTNSAYDTSLRHWKHWLEMLAESVLYTIPQNFCLQYCLIRILLLVINTEYNYLLL